ncbi:hypothetical protein Asi02nite_60270 [Asanoa siamensis]|uniref:VOC domain-containing protein n=1 Tax=Asanoa siamensis TaxID=926357 RepID=A0ABQ4CZ07_9ACTN|nr:hypothetical protein Asi02nite_60270 [Asanoa siamensis]
MTFDARDPARLARFWADLLDRKIVEDALVPGDEAQVSLRFVPGPARSATPTRSIHLHLTSEAAGDLRAVVDKALGLGAGHLDVGQLPEEPHVVLADPEGNAFCVIPPDNNFLAGCGFLGEVACDGPRAVGQFWSAATGWPLVWDEHEETAIQSPHGGTKVAWGGPPVTPKRGTNRQRFTLAVPAGDLAAEVDRLVALGATVIDADAILLADPDGNEFHLTAT